MQSGAGQGGIGRRRSRGKEVSEGVDDDDDDGCHSVAMCSYRTG